MSTAIPELYRHDHIEARKKVMKLFGGAFHLRATDGTLLAYSKMKAFKLKEDIRVFADEAMTHELLNIQANKVIDFSASYNVRDSQTGEHLGSLRRKGWSSLFRDSWEILDPDGVVRGRVIEDSGWKAFARRMNEIVAFLLPQTFLVQVNDQTVATMKQNIQLFAAKFQIDLSHDAEGVLPRPLAIATVILLLAVEGRQG